MTAVPSSDIRQRAEEQLKAMRRAFGAPGDHGYGTKEGDALFGLYRFLAELTHSAA